MKALIVNHGKIEVPDRFLKDHISKVSVWLATKGLLTAEQNKKEVSLVFLDKLDAKKLNWQYRQKDYAPDILSFESSDPDSLGELVLCLEVLESQAEEHEKTLQQELGLMVIHGVLHLLGFDHEDEGSDAAKMMALQEEAYQDTMPPKAASKTPVSKTAKKTKKA